MYNNPILFLKRVRDHTVECKSVKVDSDKPASTNCNTKGGSGN